MKEEKPGNSRILAMAGVMFGLHQAASATAPCDASVPVKGCIGQVSVEGKYVLVRSNTSRCSVIEWSMDGVRNTTTVIDGQQRLELLTTRPGNLQVESCTEVKDLRSNSTTSQNPVSAPAPRPLPPGAIVLPQHGNETAPAAILVRPNPADFYPADSIRARERGRVVLYICWDANGRVTRSQVEESSGYPRLDEAAVKMGRHYRFRPALMGTKPLEDCVSQPVRFSFN
jgi:TonB family protein